MNITRREAIRMGVGGVALAAVAKPGKLWADDRNAGNGGNQVPDNLVPSPPTTPWLVEMPRMQVKQKTGLDPITGLPLLTGALIDPATAISTEDCIQRNAKQFYTRFLPQNFYEITEQENPNFSWHPQLPTQKIWGYDGMFPGPLFQSRYGSPDLVRIHNALPAQTDLGFGIPSTSTHLHNGHTASESDGFPDDFVNAGEFHDHHYPNSLPGFTTSAVPDPRDALSTLWYHDHREGFTAQNTYAGLVGFHQFFDDVDTGDETTGLRLPSGDYDVPIIFADKAFDPGTGLIFFDLFNMDGMLGDRWTANGKIQPFFRVEPRQYRFRFVIGGPSRWWEWHLSDNSSFLQIAEDANLLPNPIARQGIRMSVAERVDVIIDFSKYSPGTSIYLQNRLEQNNGRGPTGNVFAVGDPVIRFDVQSTVTHPDPPKITTSTKLREEPSFSLNEVVNRRSFRFDRQNGGWAINGQFFDVNRIAASPQKNTAELWTFQNNSKGWSHPIHVHFEQFRILSRNGSPPPPWERVPKDTLKLNQNEVVQVFLRFRDFDGRYPMHCHNTVHEDHAMMIRFEVVG